MEQMTISMFFNLILNSSALYFVFIGFFALIDTLWLSLMGRSFYMKALSGIVDSINLLPAILFYILYSVGCFIFILLPFTLAGVAMSTIFMFAALYGFISYGVYDLTNMSTISKWPLLVTIVDMLWGASVTAISSVLTVYVYLNFIR